MRTRAWWFRQSLRVFLWSLCAVLSAILAIKIWGEWRFNHEGEINQGKIDQATAGVTQRGPEDERASAWLHAGQCATVFFANQKSEMNRLLLDESWMPEQRGLAEELLSQNGPALSLMHRGLDSLQGTPLRRLRLSEEWKDGDSEYYAFLLLVLEGRATLERGDAEAFLKSSQALRTFTEADATQDEWAATLSVYGSTQLLKNIEVAQRTLPMNAGVVDALAALIPNRDRERDWADIVRWNWNLLVNRDAGSAIWRERERAAGFQESFRAWLWTDFRGAALLAYYADIAPRFSEPLGLALDRWPDGTWPSRVPFAGDALEEGRLTPYAALFQGDLSARRLARVALHLRAEGLRTGGYPESLGGIPEATSPDPLTGGGLSYELRSDGAARLSVKNAEQVLRKAGSRVKVRAWELPTPPPISKKT